MLTRNARLADQVARVSERERDPGEMLHMNSLTNLITFASLQHHLERLDRCKYFSREAKVPSPRSNRGLQKKLFLRANPTPDNDRKPALGATSAFEIAWTDVTTLRQSGHRRCNVVGSHVEGTGVGLTERTAARMNDRYILALFTCRLSEEEKYSRNAGCIADGSTYSQ